mmetsp:Transcript_45696/g.81719  ORF Transcript_45696/g.81719 Transcript_45696/m.81719 type:complete len:97 (+) Transcript_45696:120-410(+)
MGWREVHLNGHRFPTNVSLEAPSFRLRKQNVNSGWFPAGLSKKFQPATKMQKKLNFLFVDALSQNLLVESGVISAEICWMGQDLVSLAKKFQTKNE